MKPIVKKSGNFAEEERWDIEQHIRMTPVERQRVAKKLKERVYGKNPPDVRGGDKSGCKTPIFRKIYRGS